MDNPADKGAEMAQLFTRAWMNMASQMMTAGLSFSPDSPPPEAARQVRSAMFDAMGRCYDEFVRSPQFLESMRQAVDSAVLMRKQFNDFLTRVHHETQGTSRSDIDNLMVTLRHMESRLLDRIEELSGELQAVKDRLDGLNGTNGDPQAPEPPSGTANERPGRRRTKKQVDQ